jgi:hypothetical protein
MEELLMKTTFSPALRTMGGALALTVALATTAQADSVLTVNADGTISQVDSAQSTTTQGYASKGNAPQGYAPGAFHFYGSGDATANGAGVTAQGYALQDQTLYPAGNLRGAGADANSGQFDAQGRKIVVKPGTDVVINGDKTKVVIKPGYGYGYPGYGYPGYGYPYVGYPRQYPVYVYPGYGYGYPNHGYPVVGYPTYGYPNYGYPGYGYGYGGSTQVGVYGPGTYGSTFGGTFNGGFGGVTVGRGGVNVSIGGGQQSFRSRSTMTVMPGTTVTTVTPGGMTGLPSPYVSPAQRRPF